MRAEYRAGADQVLASSGCGPETVLIVRQGREAGTARDGT
jgi:hypothetical protein